MQFVQVTGNIRHQNISGQGLKHLPPQPLSGRYTICRIVFHRQEKIMTKNLSYQTAPALPRFSFLEHLLRLPNI